MNLAVLVWACECGCIVVPVCAVLPGQNSLLARCGVRSWSLLCVSSLRALSLLFESICRYAPAGLPPAQGALSGHFILLVYHVFVCMCGCQCAVGWSTHGLGKDMPMSSTVIAALIQLSL